jgi:hypothetical protein
MTTHIDFVRYFKVVKFAHFYHTRGRAHFFAHNIYPFRDKKDTKKRHTTICRMPLSLLQLVMN